MNNNSIISSKYEGWIASIVFHCFLMLIFLVIIYDRPIDLSEYANLTFSNYNPTNLPVINRESEKILAPQPVISSTPRTSQSDATSKVVTRDVDIPTRRMTEHDINRIPIEDQGQINNIGTKDNIVTKRETLHGVNENLSSLDEEIFYSTKPGNNPSEFSVGEKIDAFATPGEKGVEVQFDKPYNIVFDGVNRDVLDYKVPTFPPGFDREARIQVKITILPNGTVGNTTVLQKANATLEAETIQSLKLWRFSPLKSTDPQLNQTAVITFRFELE